MKILKNDGVFVVLNADEFCERNAINKIVRAARTCYQSEEFATEAKDEALVKHLIKRNHMAMIEFGGVMNVQFSNISRGFTHEMVRHRLCSFAQESTRFVDESDLVVIAPPHKDEKRANQTWIKVPRKQDNTAYGLSLEDCFDLIEQMYSGLRKSGWSKEDARQVLPIGTRSQIVVSGNLRQWRHIFDMRCAKAAHWEIRAVMLKLLNWCKENIPIVFDDYEIYCSEKCNANDLGKCNAGSPAVNCSGFVGYAVRTTK